MTIRCGVCGLAVLVMIGSGCSDTPPTGIAPGDQAKYHPDHDPLINPPGMDESYPRDDLSGVDDDATLAGLLIGEPRSMNPLFAMSPFDWRVVSSVFSGVTVRNQDMVYVIDTRRVDKVEESDDHLETTVYLKAGLKWHDGTPWTAHDIRFSWEAILDDNVPAASHKFRSSQLEDVRVIDDRTVVYVHKKATPINTMNMAFPVIPKHIFGNPEERAKDPSMSRSDYYNHYNREEIVGSGSYKFVEWRSNDRLVVERWDEFEVGDIRRAPFKRIIFKVQPDRNIALLLFKKGELDECWLTPSQFATQCNDDEFEQVGFKGYAPRALLAMIMWNMNGSNPFFTDRRVRLALAHAYDCERVLRTVTHNLYTPSRGIFYPDHWAFNSSIERYGYDLAKAAALLDEAGWLVSDDDGWRYKDIGGVAVKFEFELLIYQSFVDAVKMVDVYRADLRKLGVSLKSRIVENAALDSIALKHEYQAIVTTASNANDPDDFRNGLHSEAREQGMNLTWYADDRVDELFDLTRKEFDPAKRAAQFGEIQARVYHDQPWMFMWDYSMLHCFNKRLRGIRFAPSGPFLFYGGPKSGWWVPKEAM